LPVGRCVPIAEAYLAVYTTPVLAAVGHTEASARAAGVEASIK
jgi:pyruvate/2-oxoglutarate dehydrogenase complex dihydrolipoamide dehydrogenase (E3) component